MQNKSELFSEDELNLANISKALSHPARVRILTLLAACDRCMTGKLVSDLPLAQATVSQHLKVLKSAGLILGEIDGPATCYCLDKDAINKAQRAFGMLLGGISCGSKNMEDNNEQQRD
ncbi:metalloregulator ArsR/SmtB family transcription factor [Marispirochaeta sp.]|jgi:DNA-binding transcriptional ArsR family regulator|uniref:ArsR/SmtB family transcription factor n=1 Tax=Marispirochaeta sp. TaxID=2038653 RepID=UPI0029C6A33A|nr:metalloregulator ArsR/SmtB family transcription factor [Marispirochaeta sp.]